MIEFQKTGHNDYCFLVKSVTGKTLLKSIPFPSKDAMESSLATLEVTNGIDRKLFERKTNTEGKFLIELKNPNGQTIGSSGLYSSEAGMENGLLNISNNLVSTQP